MTKIKIVVTHYTQGITTIFDYKSVKDGKVYHTITFYSICQLRIMSSKLGRKVIDILEIIHVTALE